MNERFIFHFTQNGRPLPIDELVAIEGGRGGIILNGETSAWPRGLRFGFEGVGPFKDRLNKLRNEVANGQHRFGIETIDGGLIFTTISPDRIPTGTYEYKLRIADLNLENGEDRLELEEGDPPMDIHIEIEPEERRLAVAGSIDSDNLIANLINGDSRLDGMTVVEWLEDDAPRQKRKACLLNILAKLRTAPVEDEPLIGFLKEIFFCDVDRIYAEVDMELFLRLQELDDDIRKPFSLDKGLLHSTHLRLLRRIPIEDQDVTEQYILKSFREDAQPSLQITIAIPPDDRPGRGVYADIDIDLGNPKRDFAGFVVHLGELMGEGKTDHLKLFKKLAKDPALSAHLHYSIT